VAEDVEKVNPDLVARDAAGALGRTFAFDPRTGRMWRYYWTNGSNNQLVGEGMVDLIYSDPPDELKAELLKSTGSPAR
jgi:hypothetical protein